MTRAALDGVGLTYATETMVADHLRAGRLVRVLEDRCPPYAGFFLCYPSRRNVPAALRAVINHLEIQQIAGMLEPGVAAAKC